VDKDSRKRAAKHEATSRSLFLSRSGVSTLS